MAFSKVLNEKKLNKYEIPVDYSVVLYPKWLSAYCNKIPKKFLGICK